MRITIFEVFYFSLALGVGALASHLVGGPYRLVAFIGGFAGASAVIVLPSYFFPAKYVAYPVCAAPGCTSGSYRVTQVRKHDCDVLCSCGALYLVRFVRPDGTPGQQFMLVDHTDTPRPYMCRPKRETPWTPEHGAA